jgi:hypothetical protein
VDRLQERGNLLGATAFQGVDSHKWHFESPVLAGQGGRQAGEWGAMDRDDRRDLPVLGPHWLEACASGG